MDKSKTPKPEVGVEGDNYDRGIVPAETAARREREGEFYKHPPTEGRRADAPTDAQTDSESIRTTDGYTTDKEGLINNYAIEPEMYINEPGDLRQDEEAKTQERIEELEDVNEDKEGQLTMERDQRGKGQGLV